MLSEYPSDCNRCRHQDQQKSHIPKGKDTKKFPLLIGVFPGIKPEGDQTGKGGDQRSQPAEIDPGQQRSEMVGKAGQQNG